ncbi:MAG: hypothetical protein IT342_26830 [Candidatus Melainabacteria bacterium]|nr:hypothetical protein [Candidatus Melainabacteria bacterium]
MKDKLRKNGVAVSKVLLASMIAISATASMGFAQPSAATMEKARQLGLLNLKKGQLPAALQIPNMHMATAAPVNFPVDVYRSNVLSTNFMNTTSGAAAASLTIVTKDTPTTVNQFYLGALRRGNWVTQTATNEILAKMGPPGAAFILQGTRGKERVTVNILARSDGTTNLTVSWAVGY